MAPYLLPEGYGRPPLAALLREGTIVGEAGRLALHRSGQRQVRRRTPLARRAAATRTADPVLLVPGFCAGDWTLASIAKGLRAEGFRTYRSGINVNVTCVLDAAAAVETRLEQIAERRETKVQIVGHSLGGMLARGLAVRRPDLISGIVTMGSPMRAPAAHHSLLTRGVRLLNRLSDAGVPGVMSTECVAGACAELSFNESQAPIGSVAMTNIYSKGDGIVDWRACIDPEGRTVEVRASHVGMAVDPRVFREVHQALVLQGAASRTAGLRMLGEATA